MVFRSRSSVSAIPVSYGGVAVGGGGGIGPIGATGPQGPHGTQGPHDFQILLVQLDQ